jgi:mono/diheme cytochrome c family protein
MNVLIFTCLLLLSGAAHATEPVLEIDVGGEKRALTRETLLAMPEAATIEVTRDMTYHRPMTYRAVPVAALLADLTFPPDSVLEAVAMDGFVAQLPLDLVLNTDPRKAVAWIAIEPELKPWPKIPYKDGTPGPFYLVWTGDDVDSIRVEQWPYQTAKLISQPSPASRWPGLSVDASLPAADPIRTGQTLFVVHCSPCHKLNGAGASDVGPDLNRPMNPTEYMTSDGLHALIRDPKSVRTWPGQRMQGWPPDLLSDSEIDRIIAYLKHMAGRKITRDPPS